MVDVLRIVTRAAMVVFLLSSMLDFGLGLRLREVLQPLRNARLVGLSLLVNFLIAPLLAVAIARAMRLEEPFAIGLIILGMAPGAPFMPRVVQLAGRGVGLAIGLLVLFLVISVASLPLALPWVLAGARVDTVKIAETLVLLLLLPLAAGMIAGARFPSLPARLHTLLGALSNWSGLVVLVLIVALNLRSLGDLLGTGAILADAVFVALITLAGWIAGGGDRSHREVLGLAAGLRNIAAALLVGASFEDPRVNVMVIVSALVSLLILLPTARALGRRAKSDRAAEPPGAAFSIPKIRNDMPTP
jgi:bile acid:Na+ symporter, BASS family